VVQGQNGVSIGWMVIMRLKADVGLNCLL